MELEEIIIDTPVIYYRWIHANGEKSRPTETKIISEPWQLGHGEWVCKLDGVVGGVPLTHLVLNNNQLTT